MQSVSLIQRTIVCQHAAFHKLWQYEPAKDITQPDRSKEYWISLSKRKGSLTYKLWGVHIENTVFILVSLLQSTKHYLLAYKSKR